MSFEESLLMFVAGVVAHAVAIRLFGVWTKAMLYKLTFINCLVILRASEGMCKDLMIAAEPKSETAMNLIFQHWQRMTLFSIKNMIPDNVWKEISISDWQQAMKLLERLENLREEQNEE